MSEATNISTCHVSIFAKNSSECHNLPLYFITFSFSINLILGFPANCYILWLIMKEMIRGQSLEVFFFNTSLVEVTFIFYSWAGGIARPSSVSELHLCGAILRGSSSCDFLEAQTHEIQDHHSCHRMYLYNLFMLFSYIGSHWHPQQTLKCIYSI